VKRFSKTLAAYGNIFMPTATGVLVYVLFAVLILLIRLLPTVQKHLNIPPSWHLGSVALTLINKFLVKLLGATRIDTIILSVFWMLVIFIIYVIVKFAVAFFLELGRDIAEERNYLHPRTDQPTNTTKSLIKRTLFQLVILIFTIFYLFWAIGFFLHGSLVITSPSLAQWIGSLSVLKYIVSFIEECLALYGLTVLLRLLALRDRLSF
jgi:hypothetical protein